MIANRVLSWLVLRSSVLDEYSLTSSLFIFDLAFIFLLIFLKIFGWKSSEINYTGSTARKKENKGNSFSRLSEFRINEYNGYFYDLACLNLYLSGIIHIFALSFWKNSPEFRQR